MRLPEWLIESFRWVLSTIKTHAKAIGVIAGIGALGGLVRWIAEIRKSWHEGNLAKFQLAQLRKAQEDEEKFPTLLKLMEQRLSEYRKEHKLHGHLILTDEFFAALLPPGTDPKLIRRSIAEIEAKQEKLNRLFKI